MLNVELQSGIVDGGNAKIEFRAQTAVPAGEWAHVAFTWQSIAGGGDGIVRIYINGQQVQTQNANNQHAPADFMIGADDKALRIGCADVTEFDFWPHFYRGRISEAMLFNYALNEQDIANIYSGGTVSALPNVKNVKAIPGDKHIKLTWDSADDISGASHIRVDVFVERVFNESFDLPIDAAELTVEVPYNGTWYDAAVFYIMNDGTASSGVMLAAMADIFPAEFDCVYILSDGVHGWVVNRSHEPLTGKLLLTVYNRSGNHAFTIDEEIENFTVPAFGMAPFALKLGEFEDGQTIRIAYYTAPDLAEPFYAAREFTVLDEEEYMKRPLLTELERHVTRWEMYSTNAAERKPMFYARDILNTKNVTQEQIDGAYSMLFDLWSYGHTPPLELPPWQSATEPAEGADYGDGNDYGNDEPSRKRLPAGLIIGATVILCISAGAIILTRKRIYDRIKKQNNAGV
jgi:hypothetical protein